MMHHYGGLLLWVRMCWIKEFAGRQTNLTSTLMIKDWGFNVGVAPPLTGVGFLQLGFMRDLEDKEGK